MRDERREEFASIEALRRRRGLKVGVPLDTRQLAFSIDRYFGGADAEFVVFKSAGEFFAGGHSGIDAFLMPAEGGAAFTLLHPEFAVVVPQPDPVRLPYAFGLAPDAERMADAVNEWIVFAQSEGMIQRAYDYWVLGRGAEDQAPALVDPPQRPRLAARRRSGRSPSSDRRPVHLLDRKAERKAEVPECVRRRTRIMKPAAGVPTPTLLSDADPPGYPHSAILILREDPLPLGWRQSRGRRPADAAPSCPSDGGTNVSGTVGDYGSHPLTGRHPLPSL